MGTELKCICHSELVSESQTDQKGLCHSESLENLRELCECRIFLLFRIYQCCRPETSSG